MQRVEAPKIAEPQSLKVEDYMAKKLVTFNPDQPMFEVVGALMKHRISGGPVVNKNGDLVGIVSEGDCLKEVVKGKYHNIPIFSDSISRYSAKKVITANLGLISLR
ncbi:MAG: CBS domain-containing protein [Ekhidna sp.]|nr:CBS domain-containing protein [Ekhidna sp.]